jgi:hypothetical protein
MSEFLAWMEGISRPVLYLALGAGAAIENLVPPCRQTRSWRSAACSPRSGL